MNPNFQPIMEAMDKAFKEFIPLVEEKSKELVQGVSEVLIPTVIEEGKATIEGIKQDTKEAWEEFKKKVNTPQMPANFVVKDVEFLNSQKLLEFAKENIVNGSNEVYAIKKQKGNSFFVYLAYGKDKVPFEQDKNKYVIIKAEGLSADILNLFTESELVILK